MRTCKALRRPALKENALDCEHLPNAFDSGMLPPYTRLLTSRALVPEGPILETDGLEAGEGALYPHRLCTDGPSTL